MSEKLQWGLVIIAVIGFVIGLNGVSLFLGGAHAVDLTGGQVMEGVETSAKGMLHMVLGALMMGVSAGLIALVD